VAIIIVPNEKNPALCKLSSTVVKPNAISPKGAGFAVLSLILLAVELNFRFMRLIVFT
jgi:hypothetical protein